MLRSDLLGRSGSSSGRSGDDAHDRAEALAGSVRAPDRLDIREIDLLCHAAGIAERERRRPLPGSAFQERARRGAEPAPVKPDPHAGTALDRAPLDPELPRFRLSHTTPPGIPRPRVLSRSASAMSCRPHRRPHPRANGAQGRLREGTAGPRRARARRRRGQRPAWRRTGTPGRGADGSRGRRRSIVRATGEPGTGSQSGTVRPTCAPPRPPRETPRARPPPGSRSAGRSPAARPRWSGRGLRSTGRSPYT